MLPGVWVPRIPIQVGLRFPDVGIHRLQLTFIRGPRRWGKGGDCAQKLLIFRARLGLHCGCDRRSCRRSYSVRRLGGLLSQRLRSRGRHRMRCHCGSLRSRRRYSRGSHWSRRSLLLCERWGWPMIDHVRTRRYERSRDRRQPQRAPSPSRRSWDKHDPGGPGLADEAFGAQFGGNSCPHSRRRFFGCRQLPGFA